MKVFSHGTCTMDTHSNYGESTCFLWSLLRINWFLISILTSCCMQIRELWRERCILVMMGICLLCLFVCWEDSTDIIFPFLTSRVMLHTYLAADIALLFCCLVFQIVELRHHPRIVILGPALVRVWAPDWVPCHFDVERGSAASWHNCSRWSGWPQCWPHHGEFARQ